MASFDDEDGVWRTIGGRKVFIREGESIGSAMKRSGKFKSTKKKQSSYGKNEDNIKISDKDLKEKIGNDVKKLQDEAHKRGILPSELQDQLGIKDSDLGLKDDYTEKFEQEMQGMERYLKAEEAKRSTKVSDKSNDINRRAELMKYTQENKDKIKADVDKYDEKTNKEAFEKAKEGKGLTKEEYFGFLGKEAKEGDIVDDKRVGKDGKLEKISKSEYKTLPNGDRYYVGKAGTDDYYERVMSKYEGEFERKSSNDAYKKAFQEYKKQHPNTKLTLTKFIDISEGR